MNSNLATTDFNTTNCKKNSSKKKKIQRRPNPRFNYRLHVRHFPRIVRIRNSKKKSLNNAKPLFQIRYIVWNDPPLGVATPAKRRRMKPTHHDLKIWCPIRDKRVCLETRSCLEFARILTAPLSGRDVEILLKVRAFFSRKFTRRFFLFECKLVD